MKTEKRVKKAAGRSNGSRTDRQIFSFQKKREAFFFNFEKKIMKRRKEENFMKWKEMVLAGR